MTDSELIKNHTIFHAYFCHLIEINQADSIKELCNKSLELEKKIKRRKISQLEIDECMKNVELSPQDQLMVSAYIYRESDLFKVKTGQS